MNECPTPQKRRYQDRKAAWKHANWLRRTESASVDLKPYKCRCGSFHVGHSQESLGFRIRAARRWGRA